MDHDKCENLEEISDCACPAGVQTEVENDCPVEEEEPPAENTLKSWATGRPRFTPQSGITGLIPVADRYSITRFGPLEWRARNHECFRKANESIQNSQLVATSGKNCVERVYKAVDKTQLDSTDRLKDRATIVNHLKTALEHALDDMVNEIQLLKAEYLRVKKSLSILTVPECIISEMLNLRSMRLDGDLVRDRVEDLLVKEKSLCTEVRDLLVRTREQIETQLIELKVAKERMEFDWTDKNDAYNVDCTCIKLKNDSPLVMWEPGATRIPQEQSTIPGYEHFTREGLSSGETVRLKSINLRSTLNNIYENSMKDLRDQATQLDLALADHIRTTEDVCHRLENKLLECLQELANIEKLIRNLKESAEGLNHALKLAQTRLSNRLNRRNVESCRDYPQVALIDEVKSLNERVSAILSELKEAENSQADLTKTRSDLEQEITVKKKSLYLDKQRGELLRSFYPAASDMIGYSTDKLVVA